MKHLNFYSTDPIFDHKPKINSSKKDKLLGLSCLSIVWFSTVTNILFHLYFPQNQLPNEVFSHILKEFHKYHNVHPQETQNLLYFMDNCNKSNSIETSYFYENNFQKTQEIKISQRSCPFHHQQVDFPKQEPI